MAVDTEEAVAAVTVEEDMVVAEEVLADDEMTVDTVVDMEGFVEDVEMTTVVTIAEDVIGKYHLSVQKQKTSHKGGFLYWLRGRESHPA